MVRLSPTKKTTAAAPTTAVSQAFMTAILVSTVFSLSLNVYLAGKLGVLQDFSSLEDDMRQKFTSYVGGSGEKHVVSAAEHHGVEHNGARKMMLNGHQLAGLTCDKFGGPAPEVVQEMVYWEDIPADNKFVSPFHQGPDITQYLSFEPDGGGWNNIRMNMETVLALAFAMGRTLVLPPEKEFYLLGKTKAEHGGEQKKTFSFNNFFHMDSIHDEHVGLDIITMTQYLERVAMKGEMINRYTNKLAFPPNNRTNWDGATGRELKELYAYLRESSHTVVWTPEKCMAAFPATNKQEDEAKLQETVDTLLAGQIPKWEDYVDKPVGIQASPLERMRENWAGRKKLCIYNNIVQQQVSVHMPTDDKLDARLLVHFYAFLFFQDWKHDLWMKRFVRDHVRYQDEIQCAAGRVVEAVRKHVRERQPNNPNGDFDTFHVRRGDFQYKETRISAERMYEKAKLKIAEGSTVYIATDERDKSFFDPLKASYDVVFLDDFVDAMGQQVNTNFYGMVDQLVASRGRIFFGCWFSTFTAYIMRLRGYHADDHQVPGYEQGVGLNSWYYALEDRFDHMTRYYPVKQAFYAREFPTSWRLIDSDVEFSEPRPQV